MGFVLGLAASASADDMILKDYSPRRLPLSEVLNDGGAWKALAALWTLGCLGLVINERYFSAFPSLLPAGCTYYPGIIKRAEIANCVVNGR